jgi:hypothetical protein
MLCSLSLDNKQHVNIDMSQTKVVINMLWFLIECFVVGALFVSVIGGMLNAM